MALVHIIDDDLALLRTIAEGVTQAGHLVRAHRGLESYLELELDQAADVIVCDLSALKGDLKAACAALRGKGSPKVRVPIINVTTAGASLPPEPTLRSYGVIATLHKPARMVILLELIARALAASDPLLQRPTESVASMLNEANKKPLATIRLKQVTQLPPMRSAPRYDAQFEVTFASKSEYLKEYTTNISRGGMFVKTKQPPPQGTTVSLTLKVPESAQALTINVVVVHAVSPEAGPVPGFGAKIQGADKEALDRWHQVIEGVERQRAPAMRSRGPKVLLFGFSNDRAAELVRCAGLLCRSEISLVPLQSWHAVMSEAGKSVEQKKLFILDATNDEARTRVFDARLLADLVVMNNVTVAYVGAAGDPLVPVGLPMIRAGELSNVDLIAAVVNWLDLPVRNHLRVPISANIEVRAGKRTSQGRLLDVSAIGARFVTTEAHKNGDQVQLTFQLPSGHSVHAIEAEIRWAKPEGQGRMMCGVLLKLDGRPADKAALNAFIESQAQLLRSFEALRQDAPVVEEKVTRLVTPPES